MDSKVLFKVLVFWIVFLESLHIMNKSLCFVKSWVPKDLSYNEQALLALMKSTVVCGIEGALME